ncbi:MAG TPA: hypothetical protein VES79_10255, partial [Solirubrobacteraceae bacterium]|nr:hypothetical protein [Solirubrobacteraceae bacterium]
RSWTRRPCSMAVGADYEDCALHGSADVTGVLAGRHGVERGKQVVDMPELSAGRRHVTEPSPVIGDDVRSAATSGAPTPRLRLATLVGGVVALVALALALAILPGLDEVRG